MLVFFALGNAKVLSFALADAKVPDARYFAFWWNIGLKVLKPGIAYHLPKESYLVMNYLIKHDQKCNVKEITKTLPVS